MVGAEVSALVIQLIKTLLSGSHRAEHRAGGARQQGVGRPQDPKDAALDAVAEVRGGDDRVQPDADGLPRAVLRQDAATVGDHRQDDHQRGAGGNARTGSSYLKLVWFGLLVAPRTSLAVSQEFCHAYRDLKVTGS